MTIPNLTTTERLTITPTPLSTPTPTSTGSPGGPSLTAARIPARAAPTLPTLTRPAGGSATSRAPATGWPGDRRYTLAPPPPPPPPPPLLRRITMFYAGSNIPGYLPDNPPAMFATLADAKTWLIGELTTDDTERGDAMSAIAEDLNLCGSHGETEFNDVAYAVDDEGEPLANDQGIAYWITWEATDCAHCGQQATVVGEDPHTWEDLPLCQECGEAD